MKTSSRSFHARRVLARCLLLLLFGAAACQSPTPGPALSAPPVPSLSAPAAPGLSPPAAPGLSPPAAPGLSPPAAPALSPPAAPALSPPETGTLSEPVSGLAPSAGSCEPRPLHLLELARGSEPGLIDLKLVANADGPCLLRVLNPGKLRFADGSATRRDRLTLGAADRTLQLRTVDGSRASGVAVQIQLLDDAGNPQYVVDALLEHTRPVAGDQAARRVGVVFELADGRKVIEYMTVAEARRRNLKPVPAKPSTKGEER